MNILQQHQQKVQGKIHYFKIADRDLSRIANENR